jgi:hypothetical protein
VGPTFTTTCPSAGAGAAANVKNEHRPRIPLINSFFMSVLSSFQIDELCSTKSDSHTISPRCTKINSLFRQRVGGTAEKKSSFRVAFQTTENTGLA